MRSRSAYRTSCSRCSWPARRRAAAAAQTGLATITGIVADHSGGALPGVTVTATNQATNIAYTGVTNDAGNYIITSVPIGQYVVSVDLTGFKGAHRR